MLAVRKNRYVILAKDFEEGEGLFHVFACLPLAHVVSWLAYKNVIHKDDDEHTFYK